MKNNTCPRCGLKDIEAPRITSAMGNQSIRLRDKMKCPKCKFTWFPRRTPEENFYRKEKQRLNNFYNDETPTWRLNMTTNSWKQLNPEEKLAKIEEKLPPRPSELDKKNKKKV
jgi:hypothetical protein